MRLSRGFSVKSRPKNVVVYLNDNFKTDVLLMPNQTIIEVLSLVSEKHMISLDPRKYQLRLKSGIIANPTGTAKTLQATELWLMPPWDAEAEQKLKQFGIPLEEASNRGIRGLPLVLERCFKFLQTEKGSIVIQSFE